MTQSDIRWNVRKFASKPAFQKSLSFFFSFQVRYRLLDKENNDGNSSLPLGILLCITIVWGYAEIFPFLWLLCPFGSEASMSWKYESE